MTAKEKAISEKAEGIAKAAAKDGHPISEKAAKKLAEKKTDGTPEKDGKSKKAFGGKKAPEFKGPGIIKFIFSCIEKGGMDKEAIQKSLEKNFSDREPEKMHRTLLCQIGGKKRPLRMEREKKVEFKIDEDGKFSIAPAKKGKK